SAINGYEITNTIKNRAERILIEKTKQYVAAENNPKSKPSHLKSTFTSLLRLEKLIGDSDLNLQFYIDQARYHLLLNRTQKIRPQSLYKDLYYRVDDFFHDDKTLAFQY